MRYCECEKCYREQNVWQSPVFSRRPELVQREVIATHSMLYDLHLFCSFLVFITQRLSYKVLLTVSGSADIVEESFEIWKAELDGGRGWMSPVVDGAGVLGCAHSFQERHHRRRWKVVEQPLVTMVMNQRHRPTTLLLFLLKIFDKRKTNYLDMKKITKDVCFICTTKFFLF